MDFLLKTKLEVKQMADEKMWFPDIAPALEKGNTVSEISKYYEDELAKYGNVIFDLYANKLGQFRMMAQPKKLRELEREFHELKNKLKVICKDHNINIVLSRRQKDFLGLNAKIRRSLRRNISLERVQDFLGFRLIILSGEKDTLESVKLCYELLEKIISYFVTERNCLLTEAEPVVDTGFVPSENPEIVVPEHSLVIPAFRENVKDYIATPKKKGYQSLHCVLKKADGFMFELQVRTLAMDICAEYGKAAHWKYKEEEYEGEGIEIDLTKIHLPGFTVLKDGTVVDKIGLVKSVDPFNRISMN